MHQQRNYEIIWFLLGITKSIYVLGFFKNLYWCILNLTQYFSHGHRRKAGREIHIDRMMDDGGRDNGPLAKNQPEPVTGP